MQKCSAINFQLGFKYNFASFGPLCIEIGLYYGSYQTKGTVTQVTANTLEDILSSDLLSFISGDIAKDMIFLAKQFFYQKKIRKSFKNDKQKQPPDVFYTKKVFLEISQNS